MRQIRIAFWSGLCSLAVGAAMLALALFAARPESGGAARSLQSLATLLGLLLAAGGGFMALCTGPVLLATLIASPRAARKQN